MNHGANNHKGGGGGQSNCLKQIIYIKITYTYIL